MGVFLMRDLWEPEPDLGEVHELAKIATAAIDWAKLKSNKASNLVDHIQSYPLDNKSVVIGEASGNE